ncbi:MAG: tellurite resistance TerB family protein [Planctomycetota bacterium]|jgi:tellurite resistance protein
MFGGPIPILVVIIGMAAIVYLLMGWNARPAKSSRRARMPAPHHHNCDDIIHVDAPPDLRVLNCRVRLANEPTDQGYVDCFVLEICGTIHAPENTQNASIRIEITDITDSGQGGLPVRSRVKQWQQTDSPAFVYTADLGKLPNTENTLTDWMAVAKIQADWLLLPRTGKRNMLFGLAVLAGDNDVELAGAECIFDYQNESPGYFDLHENFQRAKMLAVPLAFAVSAVDGRLYESEIEVIGEWVAGNMNAAQSSEEAAAELQKGLHKTVEFFRQGHTLDNEKICRDIAQLTPVAERYDILELCLYVAQANGRAAPEEVNLLNQLADWLEVDPERFRAMMQKVLPVNMHEVEDVQTILGVTADMGEEKTREQLNKEYRKWLARVTSSDPEIQSQADQMLNLIAEARSAYMT